MMKAKEMFDRLGYTRTVYSEGVIEYRLTSLCAIYFDITRFELQIASDGVIDISGIQAIHQQLKELGWLDE